MLARRLAPAGIALWLLLGAALDAPGQVPRQLAPRAESGEAPPEADPSAPTTPEAPPAAAPAESGAADRSFNLFGEPSRFNRFSGWGGIGGTMGQWGMNRSMLIMMPQVQQELALTDDQKVLLREWMLEMRERGRLMGEAMRPQAGERGGGPNRGFIPAVGDVMGMMGMMTELLKENEAGIARILDKGQRQRLDQIALQMEGATCLARPEVAQAVGLSPVQLEAIQQVIARSKTQQVVYWIQQSAAMWGNRNGNGNGDSNADGPAGAAPGSRPGPGAAAGARGRGRPTPPAPPPPPPAERRDVERRDADRDDGDRPAADPAARAEREARFRRQFEQLRDGSDQIQDRTVQEILKILNRRQLSRFDRLLGPPFDPNALTFEAPPPGRPPGAADSPAAPARPVPRDAPAPEPEAGGSGPSDP